MQVQENPVENMMNDVGEVVKNHFSKLITKMNEENKTVQSTIDYLKNMPIVLKLKEELKEAREEIARLRNLLNDTGSIRLETTEVSNDTETTYDEIEKIVSQEVEKKEKVSYDFLTQYLNNQDDDEDEQETTSQISQEAMNEEETEETEEIEEIEETDEDDAEDENVEESLEADDEEVSEEVEVVTEEEEVTDEEVQEVQETKEDEEETEEKVQETQEADEAEEEETEEEFDEVEEIEINGTTYYTTDQINGELYMCEEDGEIGEEVGYLKNGKAFFS